MLIKGRISKKLTGSICLPTIGQQAMVANTVFEIDSEKFWAPDIQRAWQTKKIVFTSKIPSDNQRAIVTNVSEGSITIPGHGVVRTGASVRVVKADVKKKEIQRLFEDGKVSIDGKRKNSKAKKVSSESSTIVIDRRKPKTKDKETAITWTPKASDNSLIDEGPIDNTSPFVGEAPDSNDGDISWVDAEQTNSRLQSHPILGKKNAKSRNSKSSKKSKAKR